MNAGSVILLEDYAVPTNEFFRNFRNRWIFFHFNYIVILDTFMSSKVLYTVSTKEQEEILTGSMLGDGCIFQHQSCKHPYFYKARKISDLKYLTFEFNFFREFCNYKEVKK